MTNASPPKCSGHLGRGKLLIELTFECDQCGKRQVVMYDCNYGDSLDYTCECGRYYKKSARIEDGDRLHQNLISLCAHCLCADDGAVKCCECGETSSAWRQRYPLCRPLDGG